MILTDNDELSDRARYLTTQAKDDPFNYIHNEVGYNFRLTNIQAALGVGQLEQIDKIIYKKTEHYRNYVSTLSHVNGLEMLSVPEYAKNNHWLNVLMVDKNKFSMNKKTLIEKLNQSNIESRPVWYLNHLQKPYLKNQNYKIDLAHKLVENLLCLPSSANLEKNDISYIIGKIIN